MRAKNLELHEEADMENRVAHGTAQYHAQRMAHKTEDSDPESNGDADDGSKMPDATALVHYDEGDDWLYDADCNKPAAVKK